MQRLTLHQHQRPPLRRGLLLQRWLSASDRRTKGVLLSLGRLYTSSRSRGIAPTKLLPLESLVLLELPLLESLVLLVVLVSLVLLVVLVSQVRPSAAVKVRQPMQLPVAQA